MMRIHPLKGVDQLRFGMHPSDVRALLGDAQHYEDWMGGNLEDFMFYRGLLIGFDGQNAECPSESSQVVLFQLRGDQQLSLFDMALDLTSERGLLHQLRSLHLQPTATAPGVIRLEGLGLQFILPADHRVASVYIEGHNRSPNDA